MNEHQMKDRIDALCQAEADCSFDGPASPESVKQVEDKLGVRLPDEFRQFLQLFGGGGPICFAISGIYGTSPLEAGGGTVLGDTLLFRSKFNLPSHLVVIQRDWDDNDAHCLDLSRSNGNTSPVVGFDLFHGTVTKVAKTFEEYFMAFTEPYVDGG